MHQKTEHEIFHDLHRLVIKRGDLVGLRAWIASNGNVNLRNKYGWTPLMAAALHGRTDMVEALLAAGADARTANKGGDTAVSLARLKGFDRTAETIERALRARDL